MIKVGTIVELKQRCLSNEKGAKGVCFETYQLDGNGASFIFENGEYDGFSEEDQEMFLTVTGFEELLSYYNFSNVMRLSRDFDAGVFNPVFEK